MVLNLKVIGVLLIALALMHVFFPKYFNWKQEMSGVSLVNRQMMYIHAFFIGFVLLLMGVLCLSSSRELVETELGRKLALGLGIFWSARLVIQFFGYSPALWKGKRFETGMHILFSIVWVYFTVTFLGVYFAAVSVES